MHECESPSALAHAASQLLYLAQSWANPLDMYPLDRNPFIPIRIRDTHHHIGTVLSPVRKISLTWHFFLKSTKYKFFTAEEISYFMHAHAGHI
jgi:hypothetical protein